MLTVELDYCPYDYQIELHRSEARYNLIIGGRRVGKSKMALQELVKYCLEHPGAVAWWVSPTITMAREVGFEEFLAYKEALEPGINKVNDALMRVRWKNGSLLYFKGADSERALRGRGLNLVVIDEAAFLDKEIWERAIMPALLDKKGRAILVSTPKGRNWLYDLSVTAKESPDWEYRHWPSSMNPMIDEAELANIQATIADTDFRQEYLAEFVTRAGMVYAEFSDESILPPGIPGQLPTDHDFEIFLGIDFGYANPSAVCFMAVDRNTDTVVCFDELYQVRTSISDLQALILQRLASHGLSPDSVRAIFTDPSGNAEDLQMGISPVDFLRMNGRFNVVNKKSLIAPGLALVRSFIRASSGERRFFVTENCVETIRSLRGYSYDKKDGKESIDENPFKDGIHDHMADAVRYFFVNRFDSVKYVAHSVDQHDYGMTGTRARTITKRCQKCRRPFVTPTPKNLPPFLCRECNSEL